MTKLTDAIANIPPGREYFSLEFFPPKTPQGFANLHARLSRMAQALRPLFVNVTWGAGGSTSSKSLALAEMTQQSLGLTTCLHLTCTNMSRKLVDEALAQAKRIGVRNILALRGDPPRSEEYRDENDPHAVEDDSNQDFTWAIDLVRYIRKNYGDYFCVGVAGYPEGHSDQSHPEHQSVEHDLPYLVEKTAAGADFIMTQLFYDVDAYLSYEKRLREHESGVFKTIPIIPGLMPIQSYQILLRTTKLSHAALPDPILERLNKVKGNDEAVKAVGVDILREIVVKMQNTASPFPRGFHFYTLNLEKVVTTVLERCDLIPPQGVVDEELDIFNRHDDSSAVVKETDSLTVVIGRHKPTRRSSSITNGQARNRVVVESARSPHQPSDQTAVFEARDDEAGLLKEPINSRTHKLSISEGEGALGREATWDDFPNGRWGDARSPAYGEIDGYGISLHISVPEAKQLWGTPTNTDDISALFRKHLTGSIQSMPWSEGAIQAETIVIKNQLLKLIDFGWWTVASQPSADSVPSDDQIFGWGPKNGFVFQKPFVEFFLPSIEWKRLRTKLETDEQITYFAGNARGEFISSDEHSINPVTWGSFTGKEIITPTIIEAVSFKAWLEEAFGLWAEWQRLYPPASDTSRLLERIRKDYWLVNVIHHDFRDTNSLWNSL